MLKTILIVILSSVIGGASVYFIIKSTESKPKTEKQAIKHQEPPIEKTYTNEEVQEKVNYETNRREMQLKWRDLINCEKNGGEYLGIAGGFKDINIRAINDSEYNLDEVIVRVFIYNGLSENKLCHSETLKFYDVPANAQKSIKYSHVQCGQRIEIGVYGYTCNELKTGFDPDRE